MHVISREGRSWCTYRGTQSQTFDQFLERWICLWGTPSSWFRKRRWKCNFWPNLKYCCDDQDLRLNVPNPTDQSRWCPPAPDSPPHLRLEAVEITTLRQQLNGHRTAIKLQRERTEDLRQQLLQATASSHADNIDASPDSIQVPHWWKTPFYIDAFEVNGQASPIECQ
jgi:hypothetical protein